MNVLLTGANGFIGSHLTAYLVKNGHNIRAAVRDPAKFNRRFPAIKAVHADFNTLNNAADWTDLLDGMDAVINCAGVLQSRAGQSLATTHTDAPIALFDACAAANITKVIQISAIGTEGTSEFATTKRAADEHLSQRALNWVILRPSLVYARDSYGGTAMLRALAACPFVTPVIGDGTQKFQPIHVRDVAQCVALALETDKLDRQVIYPCGPEIITVRDIAQKWRAWLGLAPVPVLHTPAWLIDGAARLGNLFGKGPLTTNAIAQINTNALSDFDEYAHKTGLTPRAFADMLSAEPANTDALWHARLYLAKPLVHISLIILWLCSGLLGLFLPEASYAGIFADTSLLKPYMGWLAKAFGAVDLAIAAMLLMRVAQRFVFWLQMAIVAGYTLALTLMAPALWLLPLGPLLKNLTAMIVILVHRILEEER